MPTIGDILTVPITDLAFGGKGVGKTEAGYVVFVDGAFPGQTVKAKLKKCKKSFAHAKLAAIVEPSADEIETDYQNIPGAPWSRLPIEVQHTYKRKIVTDLFKKFARTDINEVFDEFIASPITWGYRNKMEYSFGPDDDGNFSLGSKKRGQFTIVENLTKASGIFDIEFENKLSELTAFLAATGLPAYVQGEHKGFFKSLVVRKSFAAKKLLINLVTSSQEREKFDAEAFSAFVQKTYSKPLQGIFWTVSDHPSDPANVFDEQQLLWGEKNITETLSLTEHAIANVQYLNNKKEEEQKPLEFSISLNSFFQPNPKAAEKLYAKAIQYAALKPKEICYDLFCGTGTIAQIVAQQSPTAKLVGIEIVASAVEDAKASARGNGLKNCQFICADVRKFLKEKLHKRGQKGGRPTTIILDPPRAGLHPKSLQRVLECRPEKIVYVSCNPATMARDTDTMLAAGYALTKLSLVDQFPHTSHIECVGKFVKADSK